MLRVLGYDYVMPLQTHNSNGRSSESGFILEDSGNFKEMVRSWRMAAMTHRFSEIYCHQRLPVFLSATEDVTWDTLPWWAEPSENAAHNPVRTKSVQVLGVSFRELQKHTQMVTQQEVLIKKTMQDTQKSRSLLELECSRTFIIIWDC